MDPPSQFVIPSEVEGSLELRLWRAPMDTNGPAVATVYLPRRSLAMARRRRATADLRI